MLVASWLVASHVDRVLEFAGERIGEELASISNWFAYDPKAKTLECFDRLGMAAINDATCSGHAKAWREQDPTAPQQGMRYILTGSTDLPN